MHFEQLVEEKLNEYSKSTLRQLEIMLEHYPKSETELNSIKRDYLFFDVERLFIFQQKNYNTDVFHKLKQQFMQNGLPNETDFLKIYKKYYVESILILYLFRLTKELPESTFWIYIDCILKHSNLYLFLNMFTFIADYKLHSKILSIIENSFSRYFFYVLYNNKLHINTLKVNLFFEYFNHGMIQSCELFLNTYPKIKELERFKYFTTTFYHQKDFQKLAIFSMIIDNSLYDRLFNLFFANSSYINLNNLEFPLTEQDEIFKNTLFFAYKNTYYYYIHNNIPYYFEFNHLLSIYCHCQDFFLEDPEHNLKFLNFINKNISHHFLEEYKINIPYCFAYFTFLCIKQKFIFNASLLFLKKNNQFFQETHKTTFKNNLFELLCFFTNEDYNFFKSIYTEYSAIICESFDNFCFLLDINNFSHDKFEKLFMNMYHLDPALFSIIFDKNSNNKAVQEVFSKVQIENF